MISRPGHGEPIDINDDPSLGSSLEPWTIYKLKCMRWEFQPPETRGEKPSLQLIEQEMQRCRDFKQIALPTMQLLGSLSSDQSDK